MSSCCGRVLCKLASIARPDLGKWRQPSAKAVKSGPGQQETKYNHQSRRRHSAANRETTATARSIVGVNGLDAGSGFSTNFILLCSPEEVATVPMPDLLSVNGNGHDGLEPCQGTATSMERARPKRRTGRVVDNAVTKRRVSWSNSNDRCAAGEQRTVSYRPVVENLGPRRDRRKI